MSARDAFWVVRDGDGYTVQCRCGERLGAAYPSPERADAVAWMEALWHPAHGCERCQAHRRSQETAARISRRRADRFHFRRGRKSSRSAA